MWLWSLLIRIVTSCILKSLFPTFNSVSFNLLLWKCIESILIKRTSFSSLISKWFCNWVNDITMITDESLRNCFIYWQDLTVITRSTELSFVSASIVYFSAGGRRVWHWDKLHHPGATEHPPYAEGLLQLYLHTTGINRCLAPMGCHIYPCNTG